MIASPGAGAPYYRGMLGSVMDRGLNSLQRIAGPSLAKSQVKSWSPVRTEIIISFPSLVPIVKILNRSIYVRFSAVTGASSEIGGSISSANTFPNYLILKRCISPESFSTVKKLSRQDTFATLYSILFAGLPLSVKNWIPVERTW